MSLKKLSNHSKDRIKKHATILESSNHITLVKENTKRNQSVKVKRRKRKSKKKKRVKKSKKRWESVDKDCGVNLTQHTIEPLIITPEPVMVRDTSHPVVKLHVSTPIDPTQLSMWMRERFRRQRNTRYKEANKIISTPFRRMSIMKTLHTKKFEFIKNYRVSGCTVLLK